MDEHFTRALIETRAGNPGDVMRFVASTEEAARDGMIIEAAGWQLDNYRRNAVVLWSHDYFGERAPIGKADAFVEGSRLIADITFDQNDPFAASIERKYRDGFLSAVSVGWRTLEFAPSQNPKVMGVVKRAELLDISAVNVPSDPKALKERQLRGYQSLNQQLSQLLNDAPDSTPDELDWKRTAAAMVDLFVSGDSLDEAERKARYSKLSKEYRKLGKTAPELVTVEAASDAVTLTGLFLEGEPEMFPDKFARKGAVLSSRNQQDLQSAIDLINGVMERAKKEEDAPRQEDDAQLRAVLGLFN